MHIEKVFFAVDQDLIIVPVDPQRTASAAADFPVIAFGVKVQLLLIYLRFSVLGVGVQVIDTVAENGSIKRTAVLSESRLGSRSNNDITREVLPCSVAYIVLDRWIFRCIEDFLAVKRNKFSRFTV